MSMTAEEFLLAEKTKIIEGKLKTTDLASMNFIGVDQSLTQTGISVINGGLCQYSGHIHSRFYGVQRLHDIGLQVVKRAERYPNPVVIIENYAFAAPQNAAFMGEIGGVVKVFLHMRNIPCLPVAPTTLKKYVTGIAMAKKELMIMGVFKKFKIESTTSDQADAIGLGFLGYNATRYLQGTEDYNQKDTECFHTFLNLKKKPPKKKKMTRRDLASAIDV